MAKQRLSGILAHPTSFPSPFGIGDLGPAAYAFIDFLHAANQRLWQVLPLGPTGYGDSPYQSFSTYAGNTLLISPELLAKDGLLAQSDLDSPPVFDAQRVDYGAVIAYKDTLFRRAFANSDCASSKAFLKFCADNASWLDDYALFTACKRYFIEERKYAFETPDYKAYKKLNTHMPANLINDCYYGAVWNSWPQPLKARDPDALKEWSLRLADELMYLKFLQYLFFGQWRALRAYANAADITIIGDIPIFVAFDSADTWSNRDGYLLDANGYPTAVAGVPPDYFSETGQLWGNPLYDWEAHRREGYRWWAERVRSCLQLYDVLRIDHFRGFDEYWAVKYGSKTAETGSWEKGPGSALFAALAAQLGELPIIAEDLGVMTAAVEQLRDSLGFPGMKVLQFAFDDDAANPFLPHNYAHDNAIVYTGTHDNDTTVGWYNSADAEVRDRFRRYLNISGADAAWDMIRLAMASTAYWAIIPLQDTMSLDTGGRMNYPGTPSGNWQFRYTSDMLTPEIADGLRYLSEMFNRNAAAKSEPEDNALLNPRLNICSANI